MATPALTRVFTTIAHEIRATATTGALMVLKRIG